MPSEPSISPQSRSMSQSQAASQPGGSFAALPQASPFKWPAEDHGFVDPPAADERALTAERRLLCMIVRQLTEELLRATGLENTEDPGRRATSHVRQVAMYVCHVAYSMPMGEVAEAFGRDRSTVGHACRMVEDRRDDRAYDTFVAIVERMASAVHLLAGRRI